MEDAAVLIENTPDDIEKARRAADAFLEELAAEIMSACAVAEGGEQSAALKIIEGDDEMLVSEGQVNVDDSGTEDSDSDLVPQPDPAIVQKPDGTLLRLVREPQFGPVVVSLFKYRENAIVNHRANRKTTSQLMRESRVP
ncbi:Uu.00g023100.m01.CDS01 [Anthostomella pinea]|uniref:Uu.00g023100.m01.CDS01 n=1 Tax=Anthostomella pinea TaxID=933095 RepID=A0AAI8VZZ7_9PEZI|nr:Uu.00g023100.m01.CDS01 [Anthostomella pinea]